MAEEPEESKPRRRAAERASEGYEERDWDGHANYLCTDCPGLGFDTFDEDLMRQHQNIQHGRQI